MVDCSSAISSSSRQLPEAYESRLGAYHSTHSKCAAKEGSSSVIHNVEYRRKAREERFPNICRDAKRPRFTAVDALGTQARASRRDVTLPAHGQRRTPERLLGKTLCYIDLTEE